MDRFAAILLGACCFGLAGCGAPSDPVENLRWHVKNGISANREGVNFVRHWRADEKWQKQTLKATMENVEIDVKKTDSLITPYLGMIKIDPRETLYESCKTESEATSCTAIVPGIGRPLEDVHINEYRIEARLQDGEWYVDKFEGGDEDERAAVIKLLDLHDKKNLR